MNNSIFIILLLLNLNISCRNQEKNQNNNARTDQARLDQDKYLNNLNKFPSSYVDFFPKQVRGIYGYDQSIDITNECIYFYYYSLKNNEANSIDSSLRNEAKNIYNAFDTNIISIRSKSIIHADPTLEEFYNNRDITDKNYFPIPYFERNDFSKIGITDSIYSIESPCGLTKDFNIYLLESKSGQFWKGLKPSERMPTQWENGLSKGICVNTKNDIIIYWFIIW